MKYISGGGGIERQKEQWYYYRKNRKYCVLQEIDSTVNNQKEGSTASKCKKVT